jgi:hypothetical protein
MPSELAAPSNISRKRRRRKTENASDPVREGTEKLGQIWPFQQQTAISQEAMPNDGSVVARLVSADKRKIHGNTDAGDGGCPTCYFIAFINLVSSVGPFHFDTWLEQLVSLPQLDHLLNSKFGHFSAVDLQISRMGI